MEKKKVYYMPAKFGDLYLWLRNFIDGVAPNLARYGIPETEFESLRILNSKFQAAQMIAEGPNPGPADRIQRRDTAAAVRKEARGIVNKYLKYNEVLSNEERRKLGIPVYDNARTPIDVPKTWPDLVIEVLGAGLVKTKFHKHGSTTTARPYGVIGAVVIYGVSDHQADKHDELNRHLLATRSQHTFEFPDEERGKTVSIAVAWQNEKGQVGPYCDIQSVIIA
ncbi:MAG: hypothetical protein LBF79_00065 [Dysgonamonadaceae bacterium]|jgi:hypothetical protein|nr:hypothetical protein [Dysgonamonadaceae bacterium]